MRATIAQGEPMTNLSMSMIAALGLTLLGAPSLSEARNLPARLGSSAYHADADCWAPFGPTMTNVCGGVKQWYVPIIIDGTGFGTLDVIVWAQGASASANVSCRLWTATKEGNHYSHTIDVSLPFFGPPAPIALSVSVPVDGTVSLDCGAGPGGKIHTVLY
jgi:hypothetical protein